MKLPLRAFVHSALLSVVFLATGAITTHAQDFHVPPKVTLRTDGKPQTIQVTSTTTPLAVADVTTNTPAELIVTKTQGPDDRTVVLTVVAKQQTGEVALEITAGEVRKTVTVEILPVVANASELASAIQGLPEASLELTRNDSRTYLVAAGTTLRPDDLKVSSTREEVVVASFNGQQLTLKAMGTGDAQINITNAANLSLKQIAVHVKESPQFIRVVPQEMTLKTTDTNVDWFSKVSLIGLDNRNLTDEMKASLVPVSSNPAIVEVNPVDKTLRAVTKGTTAIRLRTPEGREIGPIFLNVKAAAQKATFQIDSPILQPGRSTRVTAIIKDNAGNIAEDAKVTKWDFPPGDTTSKNFITFSEIQGTNTINVTAFPNAGPGQAKLVAFFGADQPAELIITIETFNITDFKPLQIRFDVMDQQTARDLFGNKAADDFHITKIRLFNKLRDRNNVGNSLLVYSESLEVNVALEIKQANGHWKPMGEDEYKQLFGTDNHNAPNLTEPDVALPCLGRVKQPDFIARYRPMAFEMIANTHDRRDERSLRSRILLVMNSASSMASFVTAIAVPASGSDLPLGLDKFRNLLIPSFERLYPNMREVQRQNILSMVMRPLEEIPFGSDITRIVFFPRKPIKGMIPRKEIRIGGISISDACAEVAIIKKAGQP